MISLKYISLYSRIILRRFVHIHECATYTGNDMLFFKIFPLVKVIIQLFLITMASNDSAFLPVFCSQKNGRFLFYLEIE